LFLDAETGNTVEDKGIGIVKLIDTSEETKSEKEVSVSHILISWAGLDSADASVTRTEDEAYDLIKEVQNKLQNGAEFSAVAKDFSEDPSTKETGGKYDEPVIDGSTFPYDFEKATLALEPGELSDIVKTQKRISHYKSRPNT